MLVKIPGTEKWINPAYVVAVYPHYVIGANGSKIQLTRAEVPGGNYVDTTAPVEEVVKLLNLEIWMRP